MFWIVRVGILVVVVVWMFRQVRKPSGWLGRRVVRAMSVGHSAMTDWALGELKVPSGGTVLDIGCGGGRTVSRLAEIVGPAGRVLGVDYSAASVAVARETNAAAIAEGRVQIEEGAVAALAFPDEMFDVVTAVETHYYWPNLPANVREVFRVVKPGGEFGLIAETYRGGPWRYLYGVVMPLLGAFLSAEEHRELLVQAGFSEVEIKHVRGKNWICAVGTKADGAPGEIRTPDPLVRSQML